MGVRFVKGKVGRITEKENGNLSLRYEDIATGKLKESEHDLVVLSVGVKPNSEPADIFTSHKLELDSLKIVKQSDPLLSPAKTTIEGVFVAGTATGPKDIPDSILSAGAASTEAISYLNQ